MQTIIPPFRIGIIASEYCSQTKELFPAIQTIEKGVEVIENILAKEVLCKHEVEQINQIYATIDLLERQIDPIPSRNSKHIVQKIIEKVQTIFQQKTIQAQAWIYLYHLQGFSDPQLNLKERFTNLWSKSKKEPGLTLELATHLPCCESESQFDQDIQVLIGSHPSSEVANILNRKKIALQQHKKLKDTSAETKEKLQKLKQTNPQLYPPYLDELLDGGYIHLYNHFFEMRQLSDRNERRSEIEKISFSSLSHIVLETREAIIRKVEHSIPKDSQNIVFLIGGSGGGKSTTLCFLRGDQMVLKNFQYESQNDKDQIIGLASAVSCTFLPTVEVVNDWVIVDFAGFDDSNGPLISMGLEFALKKLLTKYNPQILVVESITNIEGRFAAAAKLGLRLVRLIENKQDCLLGITKYSKDPDYGRLKNIEETQKKELYSTSVEEQVLVGQIQALVNVNMPQVQPQIDLLQQELNKIRQKKKEKQQLALPETDEKREIRNRLQERETELLKQIGLGDIIRFDTLDDPNLLSSCLKALAEQKKTARPHSQQVLDPEHEKLLEDRFEKNLKHTIANEKVYIQIKDFQEFEQIVLESSLINTIFCQTHPEIGHFLHAPEIDPRLVRKYDQAIVGNCITKCITSTIENLNMALIKKILAEIKGKASNELQRKAEQLQKYILGLLGDLPEDQEKANEVWNRIQQKQKLASYGVEKDYNLGPWATAFLCLPIGIPYGIRKLYIWKQQNQKSEKVIEDLLKNCCEEIDQIQKTLIRLKDIQKIIEKQEQIDQVFDSVPISLESKKALLQSMECKIQAVRSIYGPEDWDKRIQFLNKEIPFFSPPHKAMLAPVMDNNIIYFDDLTYEIGSQEKIVTYLRFGITGRDSFILMHQKDKAAISTTNKSIINSVYSRLLSGYSFSEHWGICEFIDEISNFAKGRINMKKPLFRAMIADVFFRRLQTF